MRKNKKKIDAKLLKSLLAAKDKFFTSKRLMAPLFSLMLISAALIFGRHWFYNSPRFNIANVNVIDPSNSTNVEVEKLSLILKGKNIFAGDLYGLAQIIQSRHPEAKRIRMKRVLPDTIAIEVNPRLPIAKIKTVKFYPMDSDGVVLSPDMEINEELPVITGFRSLYSLKIGQRLESRQVRLAIELIGQFDKATDRFDISTIDIGSLRNITFMLENGPLVKIGMEEYQERIEKLLKIMNDPKIDKQNIDYIDLRFEDVTIRPKYK